MGGILFAGALALAGCSGDNGAPGAPGRDGTDGTNGTDGTDVTRTATLESCAGCHGGAGSAHQAIYDQYTDPSDLNVTIDGIASVLNTDGTTYTSTMTFTVTKDGQPYVDAGLAGLDQKRYIANKYDSATRKFNTPEIAYATPVASPTVPGQYTVTNKTATWAPESSNAQAYVYVADGELASEGFTLYTDVSNAGLAFGDVGTYESAANVSGCEKCHGTPYMKHGYRAAAVAGLPDFAACKACHLDDKAGGHEGWQLLVDDPAAYAAQGGTPTAEQKAKYAYKRSVMNDTHMSHAMEFAYPQSMANCVTCHDGKLDMILTDANFTLTTCKSCHPVTGSEQYADAKRAPALAKVVPTGHVALETVADNCDSCHKATFKPFSSFHSGYDKKIYADAATKYSNAIKAQIGTTAFDAATKKLTVNVSVAGAAAQAIIKPTVVVSLYGYDTKDFLVSGHSSQFADKTPNLEWAEGAVIRGTTTPANTDRLTVAPATAAAGVTSWTVTADLTTWADKIADGTVKRVELAFLPAIGLDQTVAPQNDAKKAAYNPYIAVAGATATVAVPGGKVVTGAYGKAIVDPAKCNKCHDALGTTFHTPAYGSAGVVACRVCHVVGSGGSHLEMQSRSIDSYVHAIHSMQPFDIGDVNFADPVQKLRYEHHVESTYPNFTLLNCESCHYAGTYEVPDQSKSLPGVLSAADAVASWDRNIGAVPSYVTGPASRACGSCHRAEMINEDNAGAVTALNEHTATFGTLIEAADGVLDATIESLMALFK